MQAAHVVSIVLALVLLFTALACLLFIRLYKPWAWNKLVSNLVSWSSKNEELQTLTASGAGSTVTTTTATAAAATATATNCMASATVQIVSTNVHDESDVIDMPGDQSSASDASSTADSTEHIIAVSRKLSATALSLLKGGISLPTANATAEADSTKTHSFLVAQRSFGPYLTLGDADATDDGNDHNGLSRAHSYSSVSSKQRRISTPVNAGEFLNVSTDASLSLSRAASAESFVSDTATPELDREFRTNKFTIEFKLHYSEEAQTLNLLQFGVNGVFDTAVGVNTAYALRFLLLPDGKTETTEFLRPLTNNSGGQQSLIFTEESRFSKIKFAKLDSYEMAVRLMKRSDSAKGETECGFTHFQLDFLYVLKSALLKFALEEVDSLHLSAAPGELIVSLSYLPTAQRVTTVSIKARNLKTTEHVIVKSYLVENGKITSRKRTSPKLATGTGTPNDLVTWTEVIIFRPEATNIENCELRFVVATVDARDHSATRSVLGSISVGPSCFGTGLIHWHQIMSSPRKPIVMSHRLTC